MDDLDLIRRFRASVPPPSAERVAAARRMLRSQYEAARARPPLRSRSRSRLRLRLRLRARLRARARPALAALLAVPATVAVVLLLAGTLGGGGTGTADAAIIRHASAALSPPANEILHTEVAGEGFVAEWWQLTSPPYSFFGDKGPAGAAPEQAGDGTTAEYYDATTNAVHEQPSRAPAAFTDPLSQVRRALQTGRARVLGAAETNGVPTYQIQFADKNGFSSQSLVAYVDRRTYRPILLSDPQRDGRIVRLRVVTLEYLPATTANRRLLSLTARHPTARVVSDSVSKSPVTGK